MWICALCVMEMGVCCVCMGVGGAGVWRGFEHYMCGCGCGRALICVDMCTLCDGNVSVLCVYGCGRGRCVGGAGEGDYSSL